MDLNEWNKEARSEEPQVEEARLRLEAQYLPKTRLSSVVEKLKKVISDLEDS